MGYLLSELVAYEMEKCCNLYPSSPSSLPTPDVKYSVRLLYLSAHGGTLRKLELSAYKN